jgi:lactate dehydrogenase-like 2-hydroxyacid dehydrogenase
MCPFSPILEDGLQTLFEVVRWDRLDADLQTAFLKDRAAEVRAMATGGHIGCPPPLMAALPALGLIAINGVGVDKVDLAETALRGIGVTNTPDVLTADVADLAVGLVIDLLRGISQGNCYVREGRWPSGDRPLAHRVSGRKFGIVGLGRIGRATADRLAAFGPVRYNGRRPREAPYEFEPDLIALASWADVLILTCPANAQTHRLIENKVLEALGQHGFLVNVARGSVVDEAALIEAIAHDRIAGAALDVFENEPHVPAGLRESGKTVLTPHVASATIECRQAMADIVLANLRAFLDGKPLLTPVT